MVTDHCDGAQEKGSIDTWSLESSACPSHCHGRGPPPSLLRPFTGRKEGCQIFPGVILAVPGTE